MSEVEGIVQGHRDGHGFVLREGAGVPDIYLSPQEMRSVLHRDRVRVRIVRYDRKGRPEGHVLDIIERRKAPLIGRLLHEGGVWLVAPEDKRYGQDILIAKNATATAEAGQVVSVELTEPPSMFSQPVGRVVEVLGEIDDPGMEIEIAVRKFEVPHRFSPEAIAQAAALPDKLRPADLKHRIDLRDVPLVTIDGEDARDFDDAVYCEPMPETKAAGKGKTAKPAGWRLVVAIADVSHYVRPGEPLDTEAYERATSVYFPRRVIPMLPEKLSNGLCSLNPDVDRLCMVCDMVVATNGEIEGYQFYPAVMHSKARCTYTEVAAILGNTRGPEAARRAELVPHLIHLHEVFRALLKQRARRGAVEFETTETQIVCDDNGRIEKIIPRTRNDAHRVIEEAMLAANVCAADFIAAHKHPALYRVHEGPTPEKRTTLANYLKALGLNLSLSDEPAPAEFQAIADATKDRPDALQIHTMLLRSMQQAIYTAANSGHFGLSYEAYTHFTSPIRRYPDLLVHRVIRALLHGKRYHIDSGQFEDAPVVRKGGKAPKPHALEAEQWEVAGAHCSTNERRADEASRDVQAWLKCRFMRDRLGEEFAGTVTAATSFGLFVQLDELFVEGLLHISELGGEYWRFDEVRQELRGERTGIRHGAGSKLRVQVSRVDLDARKIDFRLVAEGGGERLLARGRRSSALPSAASAVEELAAVRLRDREVRAAARGKDKAGARKTRTSTKSGAKPKKASAKKPRR
jgi:ribonuclease R